MGIQRFANTYYALNGLLLLSYGAARTQYMSEGLSKREDWFGVTREHQVIGFLFGFILINYRKKATFDGVVSMILLYTKAAVAGLFYLLDTTFFVCFVLAALILFVFVPYPKYNGPQNLTVLTPSTLQFNLKSEKGSQWLVYLYADWCDECLYHDAMFAALSLEHASDRIHFGRLDVNRYPEVAKEYKIETSAFSAKQLPSLILFKDGKECKRLPRIDAAGTVQRAILDQNGVAVYFGFKELPPKAK
ncbi:Aste57867_13688 [Aphanomyces stellatus]|uniref:Aste57867_13688 protein n=1 Tax=Aphanomyces stellatus TaxID=120398 RepID=A0A485KYS4_9STRA|nr:hypothetical protein As57867_013638 [Aphanomyces stellatus]VFT90521.1 Aste57867_13688 [Aphanomyces stellatus]